MSNSSNRLVVHSSRDGKEVKQKRIVLTEEKYVDTLSSIVTRDYYPAIPSLQRDCAVLQKRSEGDVTAAVQIRRAARRLEAEQERKLQIEQAQELEALENGGIRKRPRALEMETIDGFHKRVTSEDNADFEQTMKREVKEKTKAMQIVYGSTGVDYKNVSQKLLENSTANADAVTNNGSKRLQICDTPLMASDAFNAPVERVQVAGTTSDGKMKTYFNTLFFTPQQNEQEHKDSNQLTEKAKEESLLSLEDSKNMPPPANLNAIVPQSIESSLPKKKINANKNSGNMHLVEYQAKDATINNENSKQIIPANTRFQYQNESRIVLKQSLDVDTQQMSKDATKFSYETDSSVTDLDSTPLSINEERKRRIQRLESERNTLVAMTPQIIPGGRGEEDDSPIITWGDVASTPLVSSRDHEVSSDASFGQTFSLPKESDREEAAKKAEEENNRKAKRYKEASSVKSQSIDTKKKSGQRLKQGSVLLDRAASLTPAARALLKKSTSRTQGFSKVTARSGSAFGSALRNSYTPKVEKQSISKRSKNSSKATPLLSCQKEKASASSSLSGSKTKKKDITTSGLLKF